ncbi:hypothetical protein ACFWUW_07865, partial [Streptomyces sp. NPDC058655]
MRRRLLAVLMVLMGVAALLLCIPLADAYARGRTEHLLLQRRSEAVRFADLADRMRTDADRRELSAEIGRYAQLYGAAVLVVDTEGRSIARAGAGAGAEGVGEAVAEGLGGAVVEGSAGGGVGAAPPPAPRAPAAPRPAPPPPPTPPRPPHHPPAGR